MEELIGQTTDVYALGVIAYQMLTGQIPHLAETTQAIIYKRTHQPVPPLRDSRPDIPQSVDQVVQQALAANPTARFDTAGTFVATLREAIQASNADNLLTATRKWGAV
jgi:serine/threonine-protein kinase